VDSGLNENEPELAVLVLAVALEMLAHSDRFLDQHVEIFWDFGGETYVISLCQSDSETETNSEAALGCAVSGLESCFLGELGSGVGLHTIAFEDSEDLVACRMS
jgi:hypothetical protein